MRYYFFKKSSLPFEDLDDKSVAFHLCGRKGHSDLSGRGNFVVIESGGPGRVRLEIHETLPDFSLLKIPIPRTLLKNIRREPKGADADFSLKFRVR